MRNKLSTVILIGSSLIAAPAVWAAQPQAMPGGVAAAGQLAQQGRDFITKAAKGNLGEELLGATAETQGASPEVRDFGEMLKNDHRKANVQLKQIAQTDNVPWPDQPKQDAVELEKNLRKLSGERFDEKFIDETIKDHQKDIDKYQKMLGKTGDPQLDKYLQNTLPVMKKHLQTAQDIRSSSQQTKQGQ